MTTTEIIRKNLFPNARCVQSGAQPAEIIDGDVMWRWGDRNGFLLKTTSNTAGAYARFDVAGLEPLAEYVLAVEAGWSAETDKARGPIVSVNNDDAANTTIVGDTDTRPEARQRLLRFTAPQDGHVRVCFRGPVELDGQIAFYDIQLELASTFDPATAGGGFAFSSGTPCRETERNRRAGGAR